MVHFCNNVQYVKTYNKGLYWLWPPCRHPPRCYTVPSGEGHPRDRGCGVLPQSDCIFWQVWLAQQPPGHAMPPVGQLLPFHSCCNMPPVPFCLVALAQDTTNHHKSHPGAQNLHRGQANGTACASKLRDRSLFLTMSKQDAPLGLLSLQGRAGTDTLQGV